jgi:hypothetical protein
MKPFVQAVLVSLLSVSATTIIGVALGYLAAWIFINLAILVVQPLPVPGHNDRFGVVLHIGLLGGGCIGIATGALWSIRLLRRRTHG